MADFVILKVTNFQMKKMKIEKIDLYHRANMRIGKIASSAEYRMDK